MNIINYNWDKSMVKEIFQNIKEEWMAIIGKSNRAKMVEMINNPEFDKKTYEPLYYNIPSRVKTIIIHDVGMPSYFAESACNLKFIQSVFRIRNNGIMDSGAVVSPGTSGENEYIKSLAWQGILFITPTTITLNHWLEIIAILLAVHMKNKSNILVVSSGTIYLSITYLLHKLHGGDASYTIEKFTENIISEFIYFTPLSSQTTILSANVKVLLSQIDFGIRQTYIFTDGACAVHQTPRKAGYSILIYGVIKKLIYSKSPELQDLAVTNQQAEGFAILEALQYIKLYNIPSALIVTDSKFWINLITDWMHKWHKTSNDFSHTISTGNKIANRELVLMIYNTWVSLPSINPVKFLHIHSHNKLPADKFSYAYFLGIGNSIVDKYAKFGEDLEDKKIIEFNGMQELIDRM